MKEITKQTKFYKRGRLGLKQLEIKKFMEEPQKLRKTYKQNWSAYNQAQTKEFWLFQDILIELIDSLITVAKIPHKDGRPFIDLKEMLFCCVMKVYFGKSSRRNTGYLTLAKFKNYITKEPHFNTLLNYYKNPLLTNLLKHLIEQSGLPLKELEYNFTTDASGFSTSLYGRWFDIRLKDYNDRRMFKKAHVTSGVKTNIISAVNITEGFYHDSTQFGELVKVTAKNYNMREMSADAGYFSRDNMDKVYNVGAIPYIMFRSNASRRAKGSLVYHQIYDLFHEKRDIFLEHYHKRSNAESVFSMIKRKFGTHLYSRSETGQINELLCICLAHNICVLIAELFESKAVLDFDGCQKVLVKGAYCAEV